MNFEIRIKIEKNWLLMIFFSLIFSEFTSYSQTIQSYTTSGSYTWVCPPNVTSVQVQCWGGGGGGGNSNNNFVNGGHGGGGGAFSQSTLNVSPGTTYYLQIGSGGAGAPISSTALAGNGNDSWFNTINSVPTNLSGVLAKGGLRGNNNTSVTVNNGAPSSTGFGTIKYQGGNGFTGSVSGGGGGGSSAGFNSNGTNSVSIAGAIAPTGGGNGGDGSSAVNGLPGFIPGGGGGGSDDVSNRSGGNGANGQIILTYTPNCSSSPNLGYITMFPNSGCGATQLNAYLLSNEPGISYQWQESNDNIFWTNISGANSTSLLANTNSSIYYRIRTICAYGDTSYSNTVFYTYTSNPAQPSPITNTPTIECGQTANLLAGAGGTSDYAWFSDPNGLIQVGTGNIYNTPPLNTSTNYYVASSYLPQLQQTYLISASDLVNLNFDCGTGSIYGSGSVGFNWTDMLPSNVNISSVTAELSIGSECNPGIKNITLNNIAQSSFTSNANCSCSGNSIQTINLTSANYIKNGLNQFRITNASSFGLNSNNIPFNGSFAKITVSYTLASPCYSDLTQVPITILQSSTAGSINSNQTICEGDIAQSLLFSGISGSIQWQVSIDSLSWTNISGATSATLSSAQIGTLTSTKYYRVIISNTGCSQAISSVVKITVNPLPAVYAGADQNVCAGTLITLNGSGALNYNWDNGIQNNSPFLINSNTTYTVVGTDLNGCQNSDQLTIIVIPQSIGGTATSNQNICLSGTPTSLNLTGYLGSIQWQNSIDNLSWNNITGATNSSLTAAQIGVLSQTSYFRAFVTNGVCVGTTSNTITISIYPNSVAGTASSSQIICSGTQPAPLTLSGYTGTIQWYSGTTSTGPWATISGATSNVLTSAQMGALSSTKYYRATITSGNCTSVTSNVIMINVNPSPVGGTISSSQTICSGASTSITLAGYTGSIQWQTSTDNINFSDITGATATNYSTGSIIQTTYFRVKVTNGLCPAAYSNVAIITLNSINPGVIGTNQTICSGGDPDALSFLTLPSGSGTLTYQWQSSPNGTTWTTLSNSPSFDPSSGLTTTTYYILNLTSTLNTVSCSASSNFVTVSINNVTSGTIGSNQTICAADDPASLNYITSSTGSGTLSYQWLSSTDNVNWTAIPGANQSSYDPSVLNANTYFKVNVLSTVNPPLFFDSLICQASTNTISITLNSFNPGVIGSNQTICSGSVPATFNVINSPTGAGTFTYQWQSSSNGITWNNVGVTTPTYNVGIGLTSSKYYRRLTSHTYLGITCALPTNVVFVGVYNAGTVSSSQSICTGTTPNNLTVTGAVGTTQWQTSTDGVTWSNIVGATSSTLTALQMAVSTSNKYFRVTISGVTCSPALTSNSVLITVLTSPTITAGADQSICSGTVISLAGGGGISYTWDHGITNNQPFTPIATMVFSVIGTASNGCIGTDQVTITVNPTPTVSIINNNPVLICQGQLFTLNSSVTNGLTYQWKRNGTAISGATGPNYSTLNLSGAYTLTVTSPNGCVATSGAVNISVTAAPSISAGPDQHLCAGDSTIVNASSSNPHSWSNGLQDGVYFTPTNTTSYSVSTVGSTGCIGTDSVIIFVHNPSFSNVYTSSIGSYFLNGTEYTQSGIYQQTINSVWGCDSTITLNLTIYTADVDEKIGDQIRFYPNPSQDGIFYFEINEMIHPMSCLIRNSMGQLIGSFESIPSIIDLSKYDPGVYFIELQNSENKYVLKAIKNGQ